MPVILASGGLDSTTLFYALVKQPRIFGIDPEEEIVNFLVDYKQPAFGRSKKHILYHQKYLGRGSLEIARVEIPLEKALSEGPMFKAGAKVEKGRQPITEDFINGRNTILLAMAACLASAEKMDLFIGLHLEDDPDDANDRSYEFVDKFRELQYTGGFSEDTITNIRVPFLDNAMDKTDVCFLAFELGVHIDQTSSCTYEPVCGICSPCLVRMSAIETVKKVLGKK